MFWVLFFCFQLFRFYGTCPPEYHVIDPNHSFCSSPFPNVIDQLMTFVDRELILEMHNYERRLVRGTNMEKMYWSNDLAEIALRHARRCIFEHDKASQRAVPRMPLSTGQNLAMGYENWTEAVQGWIEEKEHYVHALPSTHFFNHYKQMIWHSSVLIGCAATICPSFGAYPTPWSFYVCNYIRGMLNSNYRPAFNQGVTDHPLRDCQGKVCFYNGTLNLETCECQCSSYATGSQCEHLDCSNLPTCPYHSSISCIAVDVPSECPRLCGLCDRYDALHRVQPDTKPVVNERIATTEPSSIEDTSAFSTDADDSTSTVDTITRLVFVPSRSTRVLYSYQLILYLSVEYVFVA